MTRHPCPRKPQHWGNAVMGLGLCLCRGSRGSVWAGRDVLVTLGDADVLKHLGFVFRRGEFPMQRSIFLPR